MTEAELQTIVARVVRRTLGEAPGFPASPGGGAQDVVAVGADHGGFELKGKLKPFLGELGYSVVDCGVNSPEPADYPDLAESVAGMVSRGQAWRGIVIDGAGIGSCIAANKLPGVRAALCYNQAMAVNAREHNDANVLTLGAGMIGTNFALQIAKVWLQTEFAGGRHARRVEKIKAMERRYGLEGTGRR